MRKRLKNKRRSCSSCKPHKRGMALRWKFKEADSRESDEKMIRMQIKLVE